MSLKIEFTVEKTTLLCQENPVCHLTATNTGNATMKVAAPGASPEVPILHITELKTGVETFQHGHRHGPDIGIPYQEIAADKKLEYDFELNSVAKLTLPTEYEVSAILYYDSGAKRAESKPVKLKIIAVPAHIIVKDIIAVQPLGHDLARRLVHIINQNSLPGFLRRYHKRPQCRLPFGIGLIHAHKVTGLHSDIIPL